MQAAGLYGREFGIRAARIQHKTIRRTCWGSSKFKAHGKPSLATRLSVYWVFHGLLACSEFPNVVPPRWSQTGGGGMLQLYLENPKVGLPRRFRNQLRHCRDSGAASVTTMCTLRCAHPPNGRYKWRFAMTRAVPSLRATFAP